MKLLIGIPAYNEAQTIAQVIRSLPRKISGVSVLDILVVDDGSWDQTPAIAEAAGAQVVSHLLNRGLGAALKTIFTYARLQNYDILVTFDADGQHHAGDLEKIIRPILNGNVDIVIGTRWKNTKDRPLVRFIVNQLGNILTYLLFGVWTSDSQSGLRAFNKKGIKLINLQSDGMEVSSEFFREIRMNRLSFVEVPIRVIYTDYSRLKGQKISNAPNILFQLLIKLLK